jgi:hypothetical protein
MTPNIIPLNSVDSNYLSIKEASIYIGFSEQVVRNYLSQGRFTKYVFQGKVFLSIKELDKIKFK